MICNYCKGKNVRLFIRKYIDETGIDVSEDYRCLDCGNLLKGSIRRLENEE